jgi:hypothetical protein
MKTLALLIALSLSPATFAAIEFKIPTPRPVSDETVLHFIAMKETGNNPKAVGLRGERSQFQFMANTWQRYSRLPHSSAATDAAESERVARAFLADIRANLRKRGLPETAYFIAASWHAGINWSSTNAGLREYAQCVENLVIDAERETQFRPPAEISLQIATES